MEISLKFQQIERNSKSILGKKGVGCPLLLFCNYKRSPVTFFSPVGSKMRGEEGEDERNLENREVKREEEIEKHGPRVSGTFLSE